MDVNVYSQYFAAECVYNGRERKGVLVDDAEELAEGLGGKID